MVNNIVSSFESCGKFISKQILEYVCVLLKKCFLLMFYIIRIGFAVQQTVILFNFSQFCAFLVFIKCIILPGSAASAVPGARSAAARRGASAAAGATSSFNQTDSSSVQFCPIQLFNSRAHVRVGGELNHTVINKIRY